MVLEAIEYGGRRLLIDGQWFAFNQINMEVDGLQWINDNLCVYARALDYRIRWHPRYKCFVYGVYRNKIKNGRGIDYKPLSDFGFKCRYFIRAASVNKYGAYVYDLVDQTSQWVKVEDLLGVVMNGEHILGLLYERFHITGFDNIMDRKRTMLDGVQCYEITVDVKNWIVDNLGVVLP